MPIKTIVNYYIDFFAKVEIREVQSLSCLLMCSLNDPTNPLPTPKANHC